MHVLGMCSLCCGEGNFVRGQPGKREAPLFSWMNLCNRWGFLYDPGPKGPAFSATSRASFKFWSNNSHLNQSEKQKGWLTYGSELTRLTKHLHILWFCILQGDIQEVMTQQHDCCRSLPWSLVKIKASCIGLNIWQDSRVCAKEVHLPLPQQNQHWKELRSVSSSLQQCAVPSFPFLLK